MLGFQLPSLDQTIVSTVLMAVGDGKILVKLTPKLTVNLIAWPAVAGLVASVLC